MIASEPSPSFLALAGTCRTACPAPRLLARVAALCLIGMSACQSGEVGKSTTSSAPTPAAAPAKPAPSTPVAAAKPPPLPGALPAPEDVAAPPATATKTASGLAYVVLQPGTGTDHPTPQDNVSVNYTGWTKDGRMFDSSTIHKPPGPSKFGVTQVIKGWIEGLQLMTVGQKVRFWIPSELAYGDPPKRPGAPAGQLTFDVELLEVIKPPPPPTPPEVPKDVAAAPASAKKTPSGLRYRVLTPGKGKDHPKADSQVRVHYSGWTPDGKMFDSSVTRGEPITFGLNQVIKGWTEGVQLMVVGEKTRFWIPAELAYGKTPERPGTPAGPLVFDVELLGIQ